MKVLWVINIPIPSACKHLGLKESPYGGWIIGASEFLIRNFDIEISFAFPLDIRETIFYKDDDFKYFAFPSKNSHHSGEVSPVVEDIINQYKPDLVNSFGTELEHTAFFSKYCKLSSIPYVITMQGLVTYIQHHCFSGIPPLCVYGFTPRNLLNNDSVSKIRDLYKKRSMSEVSSISDSKFIIGRTTWDSICSNLINSNVKYFHCNETLRDSFYNNRWSVSNIDRFKIFISQGSNPIKGLHFALRALAIIKKRFPEVLLVIGGPDISQFDTVYNKLSISAYGLYIKYLIHKLKLKNNVKFLGPLSEKDVVQNLVGSHVFLSPSTIENSSNSLCEAMLMGVPSVASYVGGTADLVTDGFDGFLYQHDAPYIAAKIIMNIFESDVLSQRISINAHLTASQRHDRWQNAARLFDIYSQILTDKM